MQDRHGVTIERQAHFDDPDAALNLRRRSSVPKLRAGEMPENTAVATDAKGRPIAVLPDTSGDCDPEIYGKSPDEIAEILERRQRAEEDHASTDAIMREFPGKGESLPHSSAGRRKYHRPKPAPDFTSRPIDDFEGPTKYRPHQVGGRVSTPARHGLLAAGTSVGEMLDTLGETLQVGVPWREIEWALKELAEKQRAA